MKKNITPQSLDWDAHSVAILAMAKLRVKSITYAGLANEAQPLSSDYAPNTTEETQECMA
jgi:hypothetical protein